MFAVFMVEYDDDGNILSDHMMLNSRRDTIEEGKALVMEMNADWSIDEMGIWRNETTSIRLEVRNFRTDETHFSWVISFT